MSIFSELEDKHNPLDNELGGYKVFIHSLMT